MRALTRDIELLRRQVVQLAQAVEDGAKPKPAKGTGALTWLDMAGTSRDPDAVLSKLARFVEVVYLRYSDAAKSFPDCWLWHPDVVEELLWLSDAWLAAYKPGAPAHLVGDWHDRQRPGVVRRIREYAGVCSLKLHAESGDKHQPALEVPHLDAVPAISTWWATGRKGPAPIPTADQLAEADRNSRRRR